MNDRPRFLALVGGTMVTGPTVRQSGINRPTLVFPQRPVVAPSADVPRLRDGRPTGYSRLDAYLAAGQSQMHAFIDLSKGLPDPLFFDWIERGLRMAAGCKPGGRIHRAMEMDRTEGTDPWASS